MATIYLGISPVEPSLVCELPVCLLYLDNICNEACKQTKCEYCMFKSMRDN